MLSSYAITLTTRLQCPATASAVAAAVVSKFFSTHSPYKTEEEGNSWAVRLPQEVGSNITMVSTGNKVIVIVLRDPQCDGEQGRPGRSLNYK